MSLNSSEQLVMDYLEAQRDERAFWERKVRDAAARTPDRHAVAFALERQLWDYFMERSRVTEPFRSKVRLDGGTRTSMRNLSEHLLNRWAPLPAKPKRRVD